MYTSCFVSKVKKHVHIPFRFLVSFAGFVFQENETQNNDPQKTKPSKKSRRGRRKIAPAFYPPLFIYYRDINPGPETPPAFYMTALYLI